MRNGKFIILGIIAIAGIAATLGGNEALAANGWDIPLNGPSTTTSQTSSSVSLSLSSGTIQTDLDAANASTNPDEAGKVLSQTATITVGNTDGYTVYVSGNTNLTGRNNSSHKIPSITSSKTLGSMSNEWGYYGVLGDSEASYNPSTSFKAMTTSQQSVGTGGATSSSVTKKLTLFYGARVNSSAAEDFYGNTVTLSVVAQPRTITTTVTKFNGITTMQQMTSTICSNAAVNDTAQLTDTRDNKKYWVTKLLDGNCWMSQNLALDINVNNVKATDSDIANNWIDGRTTTSVLQSGLGNITSTYSWNLGEYVITSPTAATKCQDNLDGLSICREQFTNVSGWTASTDPDFYKNNSSSPINASTKTYDAHYLAGNYYQWNAATAGTGASTADYTNASSSICPKGWKLPDSNTTANGSFTYLLQRYGMASNASSGNLTGTSSITHYGYNIALSPLFFVRSGYIAPGNGLYNAGQYGRYWSSKASSNGMIYELYFNHETVYMSNYSYNYAYGGRSLRCLVPTS